MASSGFTLYSGTPDNSSASSALFDRKPSEEPGNNAFALQLKKLYRGISTLETKILNEHIDDGVPFKHVSNIELGVGKASRTHRRLTQS